MCHHKTNQQYETIKMIKHIQKHRFQMNYNHFNNDKLSSSQKNCIVYFGAPLMWIKTLKKLVGALRCSTMKETLKPKIVKKLLNKTRNDGFKLKCECASVHKSTNRCKFIGGGNPQTNIDIGININSQASRLGINWRRNHNGNKSEGWNRGKGVVPR